MRKLSLSKYLQVITKGDIVVAVLILVAFLASMAFFWLNPGAGQETQDIIAVIELHGEEVDRVELPPEGESKEVEVPLQDVDYEAIIELEHNRARIQRMPEDVCPRGICADTGWVQREGQAIVCVPNRLIIHLEGIEDDDDLDRITG